MDEVFEGRQALMASDIHDESNTQRDPVGWHDTCEASLYIRQDPCWSPNVIVMHIQNDKAADNKEQVNPSMAELEQAHQAGHAIVVIEVPGGVVQDNCHGSNPTAYLNADQ